MQHHTYSRRQMALLLTGLSALTLAGCATKPATSKFTETRNKIATYALSLQNRPYVWGGHDVTTGFDCSGLVSHVYEQAAGIQLQGSAAAMSKAARAVATAEVQPGDLLFFNTLGKPASHVGIYVGDNKFIHASNPRTGVRVDRLDSKYYAERFEGCKTVLG